MTAVLSMRDVSFRWKHKTIVHAASLDILAGSFVVVVGPNGAGKSTLLRLMSGELRPTSGAVVSEGETLDQTPPWLLACRRAVMTQAVEVSSPFTVIEVVRLGVEGVGRAMSASAKDQVIERALAAADALDFAGQLYASLSGGEQRRVQFARALAQRAAGASVRARQALLLDEPIANLDLRHQIGLLDEARRLADQGVAVLAVLHDLNLAARFADVVALMRAGAIVACGPPGEVLNTHLLSATFDMDLSVSRTLQVGEPLILPSRWLQTCRRGR